MKDPNPQVTPTWLNATFNFLNKKKCLKQAQKALAIVMMILQKGCKNVRSFLFFFNKAKGGKIIPPPSITCQNDNSAMFKYLQHMCDGFAKLMKQEFEVEEGCLPYKCLNSIIFRPHKEFVYLRQMAKWMKVGLWWLYYHDPLGPKGDINLVPIDIHSTCVAYNRVHYISCNIQSSKPCCLKKFNQLNILLNQEPHHS